MLQSDEELRQKMAAWKADLAMDPEGLSHMAAAISELERTNPLLKNREFVLEVALAGFVETLRQRRMMRYSIEKYRHLMTHILFEYAQPYVLIATRDIILEDHFDPNDALEEISRCAELETQSRQERS